MANEVQVHENHDNEILFQDALTSANAGNFLGDPQVIESLLRYAVSEVCDKFENAKTEEDRLSLLKKQATRLGTILLGQNPSFRPLHKWNEPGAIDEFCAKWLGSAETDPLRRMTHAAVMLFNDMIDLAEYAGEDGVLEEQWKFQMDGIFERYTGIFLGIDPPTQAAIVLGNEEPEESNEEE